jgi:DinB family protein
MQATTTTTPSIQSNLIDINVRWLRQALRLLDRLDDAAYATTPRGFAPHRAGAHLRHIVEFYQCFLEGSKSSLIDYDARRRDEVIESNRAAASAAIRSIIRSLAAHRDLREQRLVWVRMEDAEGSGVRESFMESSISRELQVLSSHTVHHFALIAMTLRMHGVEMDPDFGMAPSTLRFLASKAAEAA